MSSFNIENDITAIEKNEKIVSRDRKKNSTLFRKNLKKIEISISLIS